MTQIDADRVFRRDGWNLFLLHARGSDGWKELWIEPLGLHSIRSRSLRPAQDQGKRSAKSAESAVSPIGLPSAGFARNPIRKAGKEEGRKRIDL